MVNYIVCPHCGAEYAPAEVFLPKSLLGNPQYVKRSIEGKIQAVAGEQMDLNETYMCDFCTKPFTVRASISFNTAACTADLNTDNSVPHTERFRMKEF